MNSSKINAVGYCRFSSDKQNEASIDAQQRAIRNYAKSNNFEIVKWYVDEAYTGKTINRPEFQNLLNDIKSTSKNFEVIIVHKLDRLSRNVVDTINCKELFADYGVTLYSTTENIDKDEFMFNIMAVMNQQYIRNLSKEVTKGLIEKAHKAEFNGGKPPLGYDIVDKKYVINETEAIIVKEIFTLASKGYGYKTIVDKINNKGYRTKKNNKFGKNSIYDILKNERYKGVYIYNKTTKRNSANKKISHKYKDENDIIRIENACPIIISEELWNKANNSRMLSAKVSTKSTRKYLLTGLLYCSECGSKMHGNNRKHGDKSYGTYRCNKRENNNDCICREIRSEYLDNFVLNNFIEYFTQDNIVKQITQQVQEKVEKLLSKNDVSVDIAKKVLQGLKTKEANLTKAIEDGLQNQNIKDRLDSIELQIREYETIINSYNQNKSKVQVTENMIKKLICSIKDKINSVTDIEELKIMLQEYIDRVEVGNENISVVFNIPILTKTEVSTNPIHYFKKFNVKRKLLLENCTIDLLSTEEVFGKLYKEFIA